MDNAAKREMTPLEKARASRRQGLMYDSIGHIIDHLECPTDASGELAAARERIAELEAAFNEQCELRGESYLKRDALRAELAKAWEQHNNAVIALNNARDNYFVILRERDKAQSERAALRAELDAANERVSRLVQFRTSAEWDIGSLLEQLDAANARIAELEADKVERDARIVLLCGELEAEIARIAELEAYKAGVEALPVRTYSTFSWTGKGRFIPAEGE